MSTTARFAAAIAVCLTLLLVSAVLAYFLWNPAEFAPPSDPTLSTWHQRAFAGLKHPNQRVGCIENAGDEGDEGFAMPGGPRAGECLDTSTERPLVALPVYDSESWWVANVVHDDRFWVARIPKDVEVVEVRFQREWYGPRRLKLYGMAHQQTLFVLDASTPVELVRPTLGSATGAVALRELVMSAQAVESREDPQPYSPVRALLGRRYALVLRFSSSEQRIDEYDGRAVDELVLELAPEQRNALFRRTVEASLERGLGRMFGLVRDACGTVPMDLLDEVSWASYTALERRAALDTPRHDPSRLEASLAARGIAFRATEDASPSQPVATR